MAPLFHSGFRFWYPPGGRFLSSRPNDALRTDDDGDEDEDDAGSTADDALVRGDDTGDDVPDYDDILGLPLALQLPDGTDEVPSSMARKVGPHPQGSGSPSKK